MHSVTRTILLVFMFKFTHRVILLTRFCKLHCISQSRHTVWGGGTCLKCLNGTTPLNWQYLFSRSYVLSWTARRELSVPSYAISCNVFLYTADGDNVWVRYTQWINPRLPLLVGHASFFPSGTNDASVRPPCATADTTRDASIRDNPATISNFATPPMVLLRAELSNPSAAFVNAALCYAPPLRRRRPAV